MASDWQIEPIDQGLPNLHSTDLAEIAERDRRIAELEGRVAELEGRVAGDFAEIMRLRALLEKTLEHQEPAAAQGAAR